MIFMVDINFQLKSVAILSLFQNFISLEDIRTDSLKNSLRIKTKKNKCIS